MNRKSDWVYVATCGDLTKIGISFDPYKRAAYLSSVSKMPVRLVWIAHRPTDAHAVEWAAHNSLREFRVWGEWFRVSVAEAIAAIEDATSDCAGFFAPIREVPDYSQRLARAVTEAQAWVDEDPIAREAEVEAWLANWRTHHPVQQAREIGVEAVL